MVVGHANDPCIWYTRLDEIAHRLVAASSLEVLVEKASRLSGPIFDRDAVALHAVPSFRDSTCGSTWMVHWGRVSVKLSVFPKECRASPDIGDLRPEAVAEAPSALCKTDSCSAPL